MVQIELIPDLSHCIETVARKVYESLIRNYLRTGGSDSESGAKIELLRTFLESADFRKLRSKSEKYLLQGYSVKFLLYREKGKVKYKLIHQ